MGIRFLGLVGGAQVAICRSPFAFQKKKKATASSSSKQQQVTAWPQ
jgi:hypothetical protein